MLKHIRPMYICDMCWTFVTVEVYHLHLKENVNLKSTGKSFSVKRTPVSLSSFELYSSPLSELEREEKSTSDEVPIWRWGICGVPKRSLRQSSALRGKLTVLNRWKYAVNETHVLMSGLLLEFIHISTSPLVSLQTIPGKNQSAKSFNGSSTSTSSYWVYFAYRLPI